MATSIFVDPSSSGGGGGDASYPIDLGSPLQVTGILPVLNGGTGSATGIDLTNGAGDQFDGVLPAFNGGTGVLNFSSPGAVLVAGGDIVFRNAGLGTGTSYSIAVKDVRATITTPVVAAFGSAFSIGFVITPGAQAGDDYGTIWNDPSDNGGIYVDAQSATTSDFTAFISGSDFTNTTPVTNGTRTYVVLTVSALGVATWYVNGSADGTFTYSGTWNLSEFFANAFNEALNAPFLSDLAFYPTALSAGKVSTQYGLRAGAAATYRAQIVTDGATHYWEMQDDGTADNLVDSVGGGSYTINLIPSLSAVDSVTAGLTLLSQGENLPPAYGRPTKFVTTAPDAVDITPVLGGLAADDITYQLNTQAGGTLTVKNFTGGTPSNGQSWLLKVKCTNVQTLSFESNYVGGTTALPTATTGGGKIDYIAFLYDAVNSKWDCVSPVVGGF